MAQQTKRIALDRSYLPIDPNTLPQTMHDTAGEDNPEERIPVIPFEGWNFMPTGYGWRSYFGVTSKLNVDALPLPALCRELFTFQKTDLSNVLVALCDNGIWTKQGESAGAWIQAVTLIAPAVGVLSEWSHVILENTLYVYRQSEASAYKLTAPTFVFTAHTPNTLNMAGQLGIFKAGGRLGFWDSADSIGISALANFADFVPSISTLANLFTLKEKIGKIINIVQHGDGFIVYATKSIVGVQRDLSNTFLWKASTISNIAGVAYRKQVAIGSPDTEHYAWTSIGLMRIRSFQAEIIAPELWDFLKEAQDPIYLKMLEGRHLAVQLANEDYVDGIVSFFTQTVDQQTITLAEAQTLFQEFPDPQLETTISSADGSAHFFGAGSYKGVKSDATFEDHFSLPIDSAPLLAPLARGPKGVAWPLSVFPWTRLPLLPAVGTITAINGVSDVAPLVKVSVKEGAAVVSSYSYKNPAHDASPEVDIVSFANASNFFVRTKEIWDRYESFLSSWITALNNRFFTEISDKLTVQHPDYVPLVFHIVDFDGFAGSNADVQAVTGKSDGNSALYGVPFRTLEVELPEDYKHEYGFDEAGGDDFAFHIARPKVVNTYTWLQSINTMMPLGSVLLRCTGGRAASVNSFSQSLIGLSGVPDVTISVADFNALTKQLISAAIDTIIDSIAVIVPEFAGTEHIWWPANSTASDPTYGQSQASLGNPVYSYRKIDALQNQADATGLTLTSKVIFSGDSGGTLADFSAISLDIYAHNNGDGAAFRDGIFNIQMLAKPRTREIFTFGVSQDIKADPCDAVLSYVSYSKRAADVVNAATVVSTNSQCAVYEPNRGFDNLHGLAVNAPGIVVETNWIDQSFINEIYYPEVTFTFPGTTFLMQVGAPAPYDVLWKGAYVYDTHLKRWGKMKLDYRQLLDFSPINSTALNTVPNTQFGISGAVLNNAGEVRLFDANPSDSYLKFGKYGNFRQGFTSLEMIRADFRRPCTGTLELESSLNGKAVEVGNTRSYAYTDVLQIIQGHDISARWHNIGFRGQFDLSYLELTSWRSSRR